MENLNPKIDLYIQKSPNYAQPILNHLRNIIHHICPLVEEKMKWSFPHFDYKGEMMCHMAAFKNHCAFGFWKANLIADENKILESSANEVEKRSAMGNFGKIKSLNDLPHDTILYSFIQQAMLLNEQGIKNPPKAKQQRKILTPTKEMIQALSTNTKALETFENFSQSHKNEYIEWITEAKTEATQIKRLTQAIEWLSEGKSRDWKYKK